MTSWFWGDILGQEIPNLHDPYSYTVATTVLYDNAISTKAYQTLGLIRQKFIIHGEL